MDLISVIVPVYNVEPYLKRCVESILRQTYTLLEVILVDDGSPDRCGQMCDCYAEVDSRIKVIHKENEGLGYARNSGLQKVAGKYVTFIDSDDWISETHIENLWKAAEASGADMVIGGHTTADDSGPLTVSRCRLESVSYRGEMVVEKILLPLIGSDMNYPKDAQLESSVCMNLYSVSIINQYSLRFASERDVVAEDLFFNIDFLYRAKCVVTSEEVGYYYYHNDQSISRKFQPERLARTVRYYYLLQNKIAGYGLAEKAGFRIRRSCFMKLRVAIRHIVNAKMSVGKKLYEIHSVLKNEVTVAVMQELPAHAYVPLMRLLIYFMKEKCTVGVYCLMVFREHTRHWRRAKTTGGCLCHRVESVGNTYEIKVYSDNQESFPN